MLAKVKDISFSCKWVRSFNEGLSIFTQDIYDICLLDDRLNGKECIDFLKEASNIGFKSPVIVLSSGKSKDRDLAALRSGASDYLVKGKIQPEFLSRSIRYSLERKKSHNKAIEAEKKLFSSQKMKALGHLASSIANDLNVALGDILGHLELVQLSSSDSPEIQRSVNSALESCRRSIMLTDHILAYSSNEASTPKNLDLQSVILEIVNFVSSVVPPNVSVTSSLIKESLTISGDPAKLRQTLINLSMNSIEAMPNGGSLHFAFSSLSLSESPELHAGFPSGKYVRLDIRDTGTGIAPEYLDSIFEPTFTTRNLETGLGLGLAGAFSTMEEHQGWISVNTKLGLGSTFSLYFPSEENKLSGVPSGLAKTNSSNGLILVIDDEDLMLRLMNLYLEAAGFETSSFTDPEEALSWYQLNYEKTDLVLLDMHMPEIDGRECFANLRDINPEAKVALCSRELNSDIKELLSMGAVKFFQKPGRYPLIITWIAEFLTND